MATFTLDGRRLTSPDAFWREYVDVVRPEGSEYFGRNLDAFYDALWGGPGWPGDHFVLRIEYSTVAVEHLGERFLHQLQEICEGRARLELL